MIVQVEFLPNGVTVEAAVGEPMLQVAKRAGITIPTGCLMGSCHACEVELEDGTPICACITSIPAGQKHLKINLYSDPAW
ncbi:2Fe-2S iron-sulfur cluster binding domain-containing protein [Spirulina subsalsa FACHB-351]|uniref:2Fe-2S iron-sulfur cluster binding domain-containing protein n=1 Tax=Spirulina subsalsa FACHB-351 TaxID=234711 RepID=A0ABT3L7P7_9CYAN|nr:2Fe-2S iron-sulfur cluster binding domain-containing protein [Spirulina subsalsa]MCW6037119.1 2Fe-2S iron-sulfur cluster binding domain-containing protein [Spirulina subsalsa FACHB-351]